MNCAMHTRTRMNHRFTGTLTRSTPLLSGLYDPLSVAEPDWPVHLSAPGGLGSGRLTLQGGAADGEGDVDIAPRGPRVGAGFVRPGHQVTGQAPVDLGRVQVERRRET